MTLMQDIIVFVEYWQGKGATVRFVEGNEDEICDSIAMGLYTLYKKYHTDPIIRMHKFLAERDVELNNYLRQMEEDSE